MVSTLDPRVTQHYTYHLRLLGYARQSLEPLLSSPPALTQPTTTSSFGASAPYLRFGAASLRDRLIALPERERPKSLYRLDDPVDRATQECAVIDAWALELFRYCSRRPPTGLRMVAMLSETESCIKPGDPQRIGLHLTWGAFERLQSWHRLAKLLPP
jgi:hypothetical protein